MAQGLPKAGEGPAPYSLLCGEEESLLNMTSMAKIMTIFDPKLRLKYDWYVYIRTINMTIRIHKKT